MIETLTCVHRVITHVAVTIDLDHFVFPPAPQNDLFIFFELWAMHGDDGEGLVGDKHCVLVGFFILFWMTWIRSEFVFDSSSER